jgi:hypothetical protein
MKQFLHSGLNMSPNENGDLVINFDAPLVIKSGKTFNNVDEYLHFAHDTVHETLTILVKEAWALRDGVNYTSSGYDMKTNPGYMQAFNGNYPWRSNNWKGIYQPGIVLAQNGTKQPQEKRTHAKTLKKTTGKKTDVNIRRDMHSDEPSTNKGVENSSDPRKNTLNFAKPNREIPHIVLFPDALSHPTPQRPNYYNMYNYSEEEIKDVKLVPNGPSFNIQPIHQTNDVGKVHYAHPSTFKDFGETKVMNRGYTVNTKDPKDVSVDVYFTISKSTSARIYTEQFEQNNPGTKEHINIHEDQHVDMFEEAMSKAITVKFEGQEYTGTINEIATVFFKKEQERFNKAKNQEEYTKIGDDIKARLEMLLDAAEKELVDEYNEKYPVTDTENAVEKEAMRRTTNVYTSENRAEPNNPINIDNSVISK